MAGVLKDAMRDQRLLKCNRRMRTMWNDPDKTELNNHINKVGKIYEQYKFERADKEALYLIRKELATGLHDSYVLLKMYLETKGMTIDDETKNIIKN